MDSVIKQVQGTYIAAFQQNIHFLMHLVAQFRNPEYLSKLLKIFKTWQALNLFQGLHEIAQSLNFVAIVSRLSNSVGTGNDI